MKRFQFKLQAVLTLRQRAEQTALEHYSRAMLARHAAMARLTEAERELSRAWKDLRQRMTGGCPAGEAQQRQQFCHLLDDRRRQCEQALSQAEVQLNQAFQKMLLCRQDREVIEQYLADQRQQHDRALLAEERKILEDLARRRDPGPVSWNPSPDQKWN